MSKVAFDRSTAPYLFAAVRGDLPPAVQGVQLCHATAQAAHTGGLSDDTRFVLTRVADQEGLLRLAERLERDGIRFCVFEEPDHGIGPSALACVVGPFATGKAFSKLPLWSV